MVYSQIMQDSRRIVHNSMEGEQIGAGETVMNLYDPPERDLGIMFQIDANRINARGDLENMNQLQKWHADRKQLLPLASPVA